jgi:hypothetical protein
MSWWTAITGLFSPAKELVEVFKPNAEKEAQRGHVERIALTQHDLASLQQFSAEFHARANASWWDSLVDGLNRLPRPVITIGILCFFILAPLDPVRFLEIARAYEVMPDGFWALLSVIIAFYFGGRMQLKGQNMAVSGKALAAARELAEMRQAPAAPVMEKEPADEPASGRAVASATMPAANRVIEEWRRRRASASTA